MTPVTLVTDDMRVPSPVLGSAARSYLFFLLFFFRKEKRYTSHKRHFPNRFSSLKGDASLHRSVTTVTLAGYSPGSAGRRTGCLLNEHSMVLQPARQKPQLFPEPRGGSGPSIGPSSLPTFLQHAQQLRG